MRAIGAILATFLAWPAADPAAAQTSYPDRPVRIIVGFTPGSATLLAALATDASAQSSRAFYDASGRRVGSATTDSSGTVTIMTHAAAS